MEVVIERELNKSFEAMDYNNNNLGTQLGLLNSFENIALDFEKKKNDKTLTMDDVKYFKASFEQYGNLIGYKSQTTGFENLNNQTLEVSIEELEGEKQGILDRFIKGFTNTFNRITDGIDDLKSGFDQWTDIKSEKYSNIVSEIEKGDREAKAIELNDTSINTSLACYYDMYGEFSISNFSKFITTSHELILKDKIVDWVNTFGYDQLVVSKDNEKDIPRHKPSIDFIDRFKNPEIRRWMSKDTKWAMVNNFTSPKISILTLKQNTEDGASHDFDIFKIPESTYLGKKIKLSPSDVKQLAKLLKEASKEAYTIKNILNNIRIEHVMKNFKSTLATMGYGAVLNIFAIRRIIRQYNVSMLFLDGAFNCSFRYFSSYIHMLDTLHNMIKKSSY